MSQTIDLDARYRVRGFPGVAFYVHGFPQRWEANTCLCTDDEGNEWEEETGEGEWIEDQWCGRVVVVMVGDDRKHEVDVEDLEPLDELDYCAECGQIGCSHDGRDRS